MTYQVRMTPAATKDLGGLPQRVQEQAARHTRALAIAPQPPGIVPVRGMPAGNYRKRVGEYRMGYRVDDSAQIVTVWAIGPRGSFYEIAERRRRTE